MEMADALCGPSNPVQSFQKHTSVDRSLQQDRLAASQPRLQSFRSSSATAQGKLDAEFHAFQTRPSLAPQPVQFQAPLPAHSTARLETRNVDWAADFLNFGPYEVPSLSHPSSRASHINNTSSSSAVWDEKLGTSFNTSLASKTDIRPTQQSHSSQWIPQEIPFLGGTGALTSQFHVAQQDKQGYGKQAPELFDDAAFERAFETVMSKAFDSASADAKKPEAIDKQRASGIEHPQFDMSHACTDPGDVMGEYDFDRDAELCGVRSLGQTSGGNSGELSRSTDKDKADTDVGNAVTQEAVMSKIGADAIPMDGPEQENGVPSRAAADELAETAGRLLHTLRDEQSDKFQSSGFLALMRQLRDREIRVEGDKMVSDVSHQESHPGGEFYPYDAFDSPKQTILQERKNAARETAAGPGASGSFPSRVTANESSKHCDAVVCFVCALSIASPEMTSADAETDLGLFDR